VVERACSLRSRLNCELNPALRRPSPPLAGVRMGAKSLAATELTLSVSFADSSPASGEARALVHVRAYWLNHSMVRFQAWGAVTLL
jgi:hypothetical protein